jgi:hypothetical protein
LYALIVLMTAKKKLISRTFLVIFLFLLFLFVPFSNQTRALTNNLIRNGGFENGSSGWIFGDINRSVYEDSVHPGAHQGNYWLDTSGGTNDLTFYYDLEEKTVPGQRYQASVFFRSGEQGRAKFVVWFTGGSKEAVDSGWIKGNGVWQEIKLNKEIRKFGHNKIRLQVYLHEEDPEGTQWQFDDFKLVNKPWIMGHKFLYHHVPNTVYWSGEVGKERYVSGSIEGWGECKVCQGNPWKDVGADVRRIIGPEPWRREFGNGDCETYPYLGIYDDSNFSMMKYYIQSQQNAGIDGWQIAFWSDALPQDYSQVNGWYYEMYHYLRNKLVPYFNEIGFKFYIIDEMVYNWDGSLDTERMQNTATAVLKTFKDEPSYLKINGKPVYFLPIISNYARQNRINEFNTALKEVESEIGEDVFWLGYTGDLRLYAKFGKSELKAIYDGYGLSNSATDGDVRSKISNFSQQSEELWESKMGMVMGVQPSFTGVCFNGDGGRVFKREGGDRFRRSIEVFQNTQPRPVIASIFQAEWQEGKTIEPAVDWADDPSNDPYKYLKILSNNLAKKKFVEPALPPPDKIDPLRAGEVYGRNAEILNAVVPEEMYISEQVEASLTFMNNGKAPWTRQTLTEDKHGWYQLGIDGDWGVNRINFEEDEIIKQGGGKQFIFTITAPERQGEYNLKAQMVQNGFTKFGEQFIKKITVKEFTCLQCSSGIKKSLGNADCNNTVNVIDFSEWRAVYEESSSQEDKVDFNCKKENKENVVNNEDLRVFIKNYLIK